VPRPAWHGVRDLGQWNPFLNLDPVWTDQFMAAE